MMHIKARKRKPMTVELSIGELKMIALFQHLEGKPG